MIGIFRRKSWIESLKVEELERERIKIDNQIAVLSREIERLELKKKELFRRGVGKSDVEKMLIAERIKDIDNEIRLKMKEYERLMKQRRALSNLIRLKSWESQLKERGIWERIRKMDQEKLLDLLTKVEFEEEQFDRNIERLNAMLEASYEREGVDRETLELLEMWEKVERREVSAKEAERKLSVKATELKEE